jgi:hypothetical protein
MNPGKSVLHRSLSISRGCLVSERVGTKIDVVPLSRRIAAQRVSPKAGSTRGNQVEQDSVGTPITPRCTVCAK